MTPDIEKLASQEAPHAIKANLFHPVPVHPSAATGLQRIDPRGFQAANCRSAHVVSKPLGPVPETASRTASLLLCNFNIVHSASSFINKHVRSVESWMKDQNAHHTLSFLPSCATNHLRSHSSRPCFYFGLDAQALAGLGGVRRRPA